MPKLTLVLFILTYSGLAVGSIAGLRLDRTGIAFVGAVAMLATGAITLPEAVTSVSFPAVLMMFSLMVIASQLHHAGFYGKVAELIATYLDRPTVVLAVMMVAAGGLSAILSNSVIGLAFTPVVIAGLRRKGLNPVPFLAALIIACNIGCAFTTLGNAQNVVIATVAHLDFGAYVRFAAVPVALSLAAAYVIVLLVTRGHWYMQLDAGMMPQSFDEMPFRLWRATKGIGALATVTILLCFTSLPYYLVALSAAALLLCSRRLESRRVLAGVDLQVLLLFISLFVVIGAFQAQGWNHTLARYLESWQLDLNAPLTLVLVAGVLSNLISNAAAVLLLTGMTELPGHPELACSLALANTFAGNLLMIGSVTALIVVQTAGNYGVVLRFRDFARYGIPTALVSFVILIWWIL